MCACELRTSFNQSLCILHQTTQVSAQQVMSPSPANSAFTTASYVAMDSTTARINKFDGTNFHTWKFKMQMVLEERELWEVVTVKSSSSTARPRATKRCTGRSRARRWRSSVSRWKTRNCRWCARRVVRTMHGRSWKNTSRRRASRTSSFFVDVSSRR